MKKYDHDSDVRKINAEIEYEQKTEIARLRRDLRRAVGTLQKLADTWQMFRILEGAGTSRSVRVALSSVLRRGDALMDEAAAVLRDLQADTEDA